ncbi:hypothetical protein F4604DRAFT_1937845 [Suillus subluteus]|nr:hypothetical protein F4604DRAFT_1937845 [Suillus subluteus]
MDNLQAGIYRPHDSTVIYVCDCDVCLQKNCGKPKPVKCTTYYEHQPGRLAKHNPLPPSIIPLLPPIPPSLVASGPLAVPVPSSSKCPSSSEMEEPSRSSGSKKSCTEEVVHLLVCSSNGSKDIVPQLEPLDSQTKVCSARSIHMPHVEDNGMADGASAPACDGIEDHHDDTFDAAGHDFGGADFGQDFQVDNNDNDELRYERQEEHQEEVSEEHDRDEERDDEHDEEQEGVGDMGGDVNNPKDEVRPQTTGWTDEDLEELHHMARLDDAQDAMAFITALRKASLDDTHSHLPDDAIYRLQHPPPPPRTS